MSKISLLTWPNIRFEIISKEDYTGHLVCCLLLLLLVTCIYLTIILSAGTFQRNGGRHKPFLIHLNTQHNTMLREAAAVESVDMTKMIANMNAYNLSLSLFRYQLRFICSHG